MSTITINGERVITGSITIPYYGAWTADVVLATATEIASPVSLVVGDLTLVGTVVRQASIAGSRSARIVGGANGWRKEIPPKGYSHVIGVKLSTVLNDAAAACGETFETSTDRSLGRHWTRELAKAERQLSLILDGQWWIDPAGVTQMRARDASPIVTPFTVIVWSGAKGQFEIASEAIAPWQPGRTFTAPTVSGTQTVSSVTIESSNDGKLRLHVLSVDTAVERLRSDIRSIVRAELGATLFAATWEYSIAANPIAPGLVSTVDCTPTDVRMPALTRVPLVGMGIVAPPAAGTKCRIQFVNADPSRPECVSLEGVTEHLMTTEATALLIYNVLVSLTLVNLGPFVGLTLQPFITPAILAAMAAQSVPAPPGLLPQIAAAAGSAAMVAGTAVSPTVGPLAAGTAAMSAKTLDVSGLFPGLGVPQ